MIKEAIEKILSLAPVQVLQFDSRSYTSAGLHPVKIPVPEPIKTLTLTSIVDYLSSNFDGLNHEGLMIHINGHDQVSLLGQLGIDDFCERAYYMKATAIQSKFIFGQYIDLENFIIDMQAQFVQTDTTRKIMAIIGNLHDDHIKNISDDGITQKVTTKKGISLAGPEVNLPNPVRLQPFRTFAEIEQPESSYVLRLKSVPNCGPQCALFAAGGEAWKNETILRIKQWLVERVSKNVVVIA
jgi:hypothetical protein